MSWYRYAESWRFILLRYLPRLGLCSLTWEILQLPLYTLWLEPHPSHIIYALVHCSIGDLMIGAATLIFALLLTRADRPAVWPQPQIAAVMTASGVSYTLLSERVNLAQGNWAYSEWMPLLPWLDVGLAPILQWLLVPLAAWGWALDRRPNL